jgi:hypothetical protein
MVAPHKFSEHEVPSIGNCRFLAQEEEDEEEEEPDQQEEEEGGQNGKVNAYMYTPVSCSRQEPPAAARDLAGLSKKRPLLCSKCAYKL